MLPVVAIEGANTILPPVAVVSSVVMRESASVKLAFICVALIVVPEVNVLGTAARASMPALRIREPPMSCARPGLNRLKTSKVRMVFLLAGNGWGRDHEPQVQLSQVEVSQVQVVLADDPPPPPPPHAACATKTNSMETPVNTRLLVMIFASHTSVRNH